MERTAINTLKWTVVAAGCACAIVGVSAITAYAQPAPPPATPPSTTPPPTETMPAAPPPTASPAPAPTPVVTAAPPPIVEPMPPATDAAPPAEEPAPGADAETMAHAPMGIHAWGRVGLTMHGPKPKAIKHLSEDGDLELHFDGNATQEIGVTGNIAAIFGPSASPSGTPDIQGTLAILDLIARFDIIDAFHIWAGRMLVPSDRANFSGTWFEAPWNYPGTYSLSPGTGGHGWIGPREGPYGRNDGVTIWGQAQGGLFKYYASAFDLWDPTKKPLWSGRLNLSLLNPEPGYYHSSTYYGKDILAIGVGGQLQKNGSLPMTGAGVDDYALFNADVLFEKDLKESGVLDLEGAFYKYVGDFEPFKWSYLLLASYLLPGDAGPGKIQPLVRFQSAKAVATGKMDNSIEAQVGYVIAQYDARLALGYQYTDNSGVKANYVYLGAQVLK